nr:hypothetical protein [Tanacetum cinerariifolium]
ASIALEVLNESTGKSAVSGEGVGTSLEVPDETKDKSKAQDELEDWVSIDDETFLFDDKEGNLEDIPWVYTDEDESNDDDEEDDESIDIKSTDDEKTDTDVEDLVKGVAEMNIAEEAEEEKAEKLKNKRLMKNSSQTHTEDLNLKVSRDDVSKFIKVKQERVAQEKIPKYSTTPYDQVAEDEHTKKEILFQMMMACKSHKKHPTHKDIWHDDKDQDPPARSDQVMKKRRTRKDAKPLNKSSKSKKSAKVQMDVEEPNLDNTANDADEPQADAIPKIPKKDCVKIEKKFSYGYLEEIILRRADQKLYKIKEGDFLDFRLNDTKDMFFLIAQNKLFNLEGDVIVDFVTALKMFTQRIIIQNQVKTFS